MRLKVFHHKWNLIYIKLETFLPYLNMVKLKNQSWIINNNSKNTLILTIAIYPAAQVMFYPYFKAKIKELLIKV